MNNYATGNVGCKGCDAYAIGGLIGLNSNKSQISNSYALGDVIGTNAGGLVGNNAGTIKDTYSVGKVSNSFYSGGLVGINSGSVSNSYWDIQTSGQSSSTGGTGKTTIQLYQQITYTDWDFVNVWGIYEGQSYPFLLNLNLNY